MRSRGTMSAGSLASPGTRRCFTMPVNQSREYERATQQALQEDAALLNGDDPAATPVPSKAASPLSAAEKAQRLRDLGPAVYLYGSSAALLGENMDVDTWKVYVDGFLEELDSPADPVARMLAEQLALAHH